MNTKFVQRLQFRTAIDSSEQQECPVLQTSQEIIYWFPGLEAGSGPEFSARFHTAIQEDTQTTRAQVCRVLYIAIQAETMSRRRM